MVVVYFMRAYFRFVLFCVFGCWIFASTSHAQGREGVQCGFDALLEEEIYSSVEVERFQAQISRHIEEKRSRVQRERKKYGAAYREAEEPVYRLPVVVHVLHFKDEPLGTNTNIGKVYLEGMLSYVNQYFSATLPADKRVIDPIFKDVDSGDTGIRFAFALRDPHGLPTDGILRVPIERVGPSIFLTGRAATSSQTSPHYISPPWDQHKYINIWIVPFSRGVGALGVASQPLTGRLLGLKPGDSNSSGGFRPPALASFDGASVVHVVIGGGEPAPPGVAAPIAPPVATLSHELGHYLGLFHPWGRGVNAISGVSGCLADDWCEDTPSSDGARLVSGSMIYPSGSPECRVYSGCGDVDDPKNTAMVENIMSNNVGCAQTLFTLCQRERMRTVLETAPARRSLWENNDALVPVPTALRQLTDNAGFISPDREYNGCNSQTLLEDIRIANYGSNDVCTLKIGVYFNGVLQRTKEMDFIPPLSSLDRGVIFGREGMLLDYPDDMYEGTISLRILDVNGNADSHSMYGRNTYEVKLRRVPVTTDLPVLDLQGSAPNWDFVSEYENATSIVTNSAGKKILRVHMKDTPFEASQKRVMLLSPYTRGSALMVDNGGRVGYRLLLHLRYSYIPNDFSEGDRVVLFLRGCDGTQRVLFDENDVNLATSYYVEEEVVPSARTFRELRIPVNNSFFLPQVLGDSIQIGLLVQNGRGSDVFIEKLETTREVTSDLHDIDLALITASYDPFVCDSDTRLVHHIAHEQMLVNYGYNRVRTLFYAIRSEARDIILTPPVLDWPVHGFSGWGISGTSPSFTAVGVRAMLSGPSFMLEGFNRFSTTISESLLPEDGPFSNNTRYYTMYYTQESPSRVINTPTETFSSPSVDWQAAKEGKEGVGWAHNSDDLHMELPFSDSKTLEGVYYRFMSKRLDFTSANNFSLSFRVAYSGSATQNDILRVYAVRGCGVSADTLLYTKQGAALSTAVSSALDWAPMGVSDWREEEIDLAPLFGQKDVFLLFVGIKGSDEGRAIYLDDILISDGTLPPTLPASSSLAPVLGSPRLSQEAMAFSPNPFTSFLQIKGLDKAARLTVRTFSGAVLWDTVLRSSGAVDLRFLPQGVYVVTLQNAERVFTRRLIKR